jgi:hypothetical protein
MATCSVEGCDITVLVARGLCRKHYLRWYRYGDSSVVFRVRAEDGAPQEFIEMALKHQDKEACLHWPFFRNGGGYAQLATEGSQIVSRYICERVHGPPPTPTHEACHNCGKGHLGCINPHHLRWDTRTGNQSDRVVHGTDTRGERNGEAKLTKLQASEIRRSQGSQRDVAKKYAVSQTTVWRIRNGRNWSEQN